MSLVDKKKSFPEIRAAESKDREEDKERERGRERKRALKLLKTGHPVYYVHTRTRRLRTEDGARNRTEQNGTERN